MLLTFDIDCGPLVRGHRFIARGICDKGTLEWDDRMTSPAFSLEYELVPGITADEDRRAPFSYLVGIDYEADVPLPWAVNDGGAIAPPEGGATTHGSRGDWPLPPGARVLRFTLTGVDPVTDYPMDAAAGVLSVDLGGARAWWEPAR
jgi:hypothetical protein